MVLLSLSLWTCGAHYLDLDCVREIASVRNAEHSRVAREAVSAALEGEVDVAVYSRFKEAVDRLQLTTPESPHTHIGQEM